MRTAFAGVVLVLLASEALGAEDHHWYAVVSAGPASHHEVCSKAESLVALASCDDESVSLQVLLGRTLGKAWATELTYVDAGEATAYASGAGGGTVTVRPRLLTATVVYNAPLSARVNLFLKGGLTYYDTQIDYTGGFAVATGLRRKQETGLEQTIGGGIELLISRILVFRAEYAHFNVNDVEFGDIDMTTVGLRLNF